MRGDLRDLGRFFFDFLRFRFVGYGAYSLDLDIFAYIKVTYYGEYLEVAEDLNLRIMDIVTKAVLRVSLLMHGNRNEMAVHTRSLPNDFRRAPVLEKG